MPTKLQLAKKGRKKKIRRNKVPLLFGGPQRRVVISRFLIRNPRKPNSAKRRVVKAGITNNNYNNKIVFCKLPGLDQNTHEGALCLIEGKGAKDLPGINYTLIRGALSYQKLEQFGRENKRSKFGAPKIRNRIRMDHIKEEQSIEDFISEEDKIKLRILRGMHNHHYMLRYDWQVFF